MSDDALPPVPVHMKDMGKLVSFNDIGTARPIFKNDGKKYRTNFSRVACMIVKINLDGKRVSTGSASLTTVDTSMSFLPDETGVDMALIVQKSIEKGATEEKALDAALNEWIRARDKSGRVVVEEKEEFNQFVIPL